MATINLQKIVKSLSFTAPRCYTSIIVDTFEPTFGVVSFTDCASNVSWTLIKAIKSSFVIITK